MKHKDNEFAERRSAAKDAKSALLEKAKAKQDDPATEARRAERAAIVAARVERQAVKRADEERRKLEEEDRRKREEAERMAALEIQKAAEEEARLAESKKLVARVLEDEAARKAARDARYAARQNRKG